MRQSLTVTIPTFNRAKSLEECLDSLAKQTDKNFEVLVIDGGSKEETYETIKRYEKELKIKILIDKTPHLSYIRDLGWRKSKGEIVASIDDDVVVSKSWVSSIKRVLVDKTVGGVTGPTVIPKKLLKNRDVFLFHTTKNPFLKLVGEIYFRLFMQGEKYGIGKIYPSGAWSPGSNFPQALKLKKPIEIDYLEACNFALRRNVLEKIGNYDLGYKETSEWCEVDLAFRIRKAGYRLLFDPKVAVEHHVSPAGVFSRRAHILPRLQNFLRFYLRTYYPKSPLGLLQFLLYLQFLSIYGIYLFLGKPFLKLRESEEIKEIKKISESIEGWLNETEGVFLYQLAEQCRGKGVIVEIGSFKGKSTIWLGSGAKKGKKVKVYAIDPHTGSQETISTFGKISTLREFQKNLHRVHIEDIVVPIVATSAEAAVKFTHPVELIFIDGSHEYDDVKLDFKLWFPKVAYGGYMVFHDTLGGYSGPKKVVEEFLFQGNNFRNLKILESITAGQKVKKNSLIDRLRNRYILFLKHACEFLKEWHLPKGVVLAGKCLLRFIQMV